MMMITLAKAMPKYIFTQPRRIDDGGRTQRRRRTSYVVHIEGLPTCRIPRNVQRKQRREPIHRSIAKSSEHVLRQANDLGRRTSPPSACSDHRVRRELTLGLRTNPREEIFFRLTTT